MMMKMHDESCSPQAAGFGHAAPTRHDADERRARLPLVGRRRAYDARQRHFLAEAFIKIPHFMRIHVPPFSPRAVYATSTFVILAIDKLALTTHAILPHYIFLLVIVKHKFHDIDCYCCSSLRFYGLKTSH